MCWLIAKKKWSRTKITLEKYLTAKNFHHNVKGSHYLKKIKYPKIIQFGQFIMTNISHRHTPTFYQLVFTLDWLSETRINKGLKK